MKEINSIGWSRQEKKWLPVQSYNQSYEKILTEGVEMYFPTMLEAQLVNGEFVKFDINKNCYPVRECTGLKDKNGVEIYEGDIVRATFSLSSPDICEVVYSAPAFMLAKGGYRLPMESTAIAIDSKYFEVIGNIYENPELLK